MLTPKKTIIKLKSRFFMYCFNVYLHELDNAN